MITKIDYPPLLKPGFYKYTLPDFYSAFVSNFPASATRQILYKNLEDIISVLKSKGVSGDLWINGSFLTQKLDPNDIDIILRLDENEINSADQNKLDVISWFSNNLKNSHLCDSYVFVEYPVGHSDYWTGEYNKAYWLRQWGFSRSGSMKGIAVLNLS